MRTVWLTAFVGLAWAFAVVGQQPPAAQAPLVAGDAAPQLPVGKWIKGDGVGEFKAGQVYVVHFWATWNGLCRRAMPQLTTLQRKYKDQVTVVGVNVWEYSPDNVEDYVKQLGDSMDFQVGVDQPPPGQREGPVTRLWLRAARQANLPSAFIVDKEGRIAWIGSPLAIDRPLAQIIAGKYDPQAESQLSSTLADLKDQEQSAIKAGEFDKAIELAGKIIETDGAQAPLQGVVMVRALYGKEDFAGGNGVAAKLLDRYGNDAAMLRELAWAIIRSNAPQVDARLALAAAQKLQKASDGAWGDKHILAQAYFACADFKRAVDTQGQVVEMTDGAMKDYQQDILLRFKVAAGM
jgi:thiol-disulfide isomerase/thioredoxin